MNLATMFCFFLEIFLLSSSPKNWEEFGIYFFGHSANSNKVLENLARKKVYNTKIGGERKPWLATVKKIGKYCMEFPKIKKK